MKLTLIVQYLIDKNNFKSTKTEHEITDAKQFNDLDINLDKPDSYRFELISSKNYTKAEFKKAFFELILNNAFLEEEKEVCICIRKLNDPTLSEMNADQFKDKMEMEMETQKEQIIVESEKKLIADCLAIPIRKHELNDKDLKSYIKTSIENLINLYDSSYYAPYSVVTQSSGYGKTRSLLLLKDEWFIVYTCLRDKSSTGYPNRSLVADCLLDAEDNNDDVLIENKFTNYYISYLNVIQRYDSPNKFYEANNECSFQNRMIEAIKQKNKLTINFDQISKQKRYLFVFDEASALLELIKKDHLDGFNNRFLIIRRILKQFESNCFFTIFIDTVSRINNFLPSTKYDLSARVSKGGLQLFEPIYFLPTFDVFADKEKILNLKSATSIYSICSFGRPLWGSWIHTYYSKFQKSTITINKIIETGKFKLVGGRHVSSVKNLEENDVLAMFASRIHLIINSFADVASNMVASNMATCYFISEKRDSVKIFYPSEPVLAESSAQLFFRFKQDFGYLLKCLYNALVSNNLLDQGKMGELVFQIILIRAWDICIKQFHPLELFSSAVKVGHFFQVLFGDEMTSAIFNENLKQLSDYYLYFTHFIQVDFTVTKKDLINALRRGSAIISKRGQRFFDLILPICGNMDDFEQINAILIQVKNQSRAYSFGVEETLSINHIFAGFEFADQPQLSLFVDLFSKNEEVENTFNLISFAKLKQQKQTNLIRTLSYSFKSKSCLIKKIEDFLQNESTRKTDEKENDDAKRKAKSEFIKSNISKDIDQIDPEFISYLINRFGFGFFKQNLNRYYYECLKYLSRRHRCVVVKGLSQSIYPFLSNEEIITLRSICQAQYLKPSYTGITKDEDSKTYEIMKFASFDLK